MLGSLDILLDSAPFMLMGMAVAGLVKVFLSPHAVARHLGKGRFLPVLKAALVGVPLPLCSCAVLPAAATLKSQGANNGATTSFLISTPETGVDSLAITYALMDPVMTAARPLAALATAITAGSAENFFSQKTQEIDVPAGLSCPVDNCRDEQEGPPQVYSTHDSWLKKIWAGQRYAFVEIWQDMAGWFFAGILLAGVITSLIPPDFFTGLLGGGLGSMLLMLAMGMPIYVCASASTPIAAALILKGVSPGAALVFLLAGPATNVTSLSVLTRLLGTRATAIYVVAIAVVSVASGLLLDLVYQGLGISPTAMLGTAAVAAPTWLRWLSVLVLVAISIKPIVRRAAARLVKKPTGQAAGAGEDDTFESKGCAGST